jgi:hypothetical protein
MKRIFDPLFRYTPSYQTDVRKTFKRIRGEQKAGERDGVASSAHQPEQNVLRLDWRKAGSK